MSVWTFRQVLSSGFGQALARTNHGTSLTTWRGQVWRSTDGGLTWTHTVTLPWGGGGVVSPVNTSGHWGLNTTAAGYGVGKSTDDGVTVPSNTGLTPFEMVAAAFDGVSTAIFLDASGNIQWTTDGGTTYNAAVAPWNGGTGAIQAGGLVWNGSQFVALYANPTGMIDTGIFYTAPGGFTQGAGPAFSAAQNYSRSDQGIQPGGNSDVALNFDSVSGLYSSNGQDVSGNASYVSAATLAALATAPIVTPSVLSGLGHPSRGSWLFGTEIFVSDAGGNLAHSTDGGSTWALDTLNFAIVGESVISIIYDFNHGNLIAVGNQGSVSTLPHSAGVVVPNVVGDVLAAGESAITSLGLTVGGPTAVSSTTVDNGIISAQSPVGGTVVAPGSAVSITYSTGPTVPDVLGLTIFPAGTALIAAGLTLGVVSNQLSTVPAGQIIAQSPLAGVTHIHLGSSVNVTISLGPLGDIVPNLVGNSVSSAAIELMLAGLDLGTVTFVPSEAQGPGNVVTQSIPSGTVVNPGTKINVTVSALIPPFDVDVTVISQYANSPTILRLVENMAEYIDPRTNFEQFYSLVWNVDTAVGFGLDIWGRIVGVSRLLNLGSVGQVFGFDNADVPFDWQNFAGPSGGGGPFFTGGSGSSVILADDPYRVLILTKALANITATTSQALNRLIRNLFPGRGVCFVRDNLDMTMSYVFKFSLSPVEFAILTQSGVLPHPAGVGFNVIVVPPSLFGFSEAGVGVYQPFNFGVFFLP